MKHKDFESHRTLSAYERRKQNSKAIASVQFKDKYPQEHSKHQWGPEKKPKDVWTAEDESKEQELWDE